MKKMLLIALAALWCGSALAERIMPYPLSPLTLDGKLGFRKLVCDVDDRFVRNHLYIYECVDDTIDPHHLHYELVLPGIRDTRFSSVSNSSDKITLWNYGDVTYTGDFVSLFLGFTKEQALQFFDDLLEFKAEYRMPSISVFKGDFTEKIYRFKGRNIFVPQGFDDVVYIRSVLGDINEKYFLLRPYYCKKTYISEASIPLFKQALEAYQETEKKAPCTDTDLSEVLDMSGLCHYKKLGIRVRGVGISLTDFGVYEADNPQYESERLFAVDWMFKTAESFPLGSSREDALRNIDAYEQAITYAYEHKLGWYKEKKFAYSDKDEKYPGEEMKIGLVDFYVTGVMDFKMVTLLPFRYGCCSFTVNKATLEDMRKCLRK